MAAPITIGTAGTKWLKDANTIGVGTGNVYSANGTYLQYTVPVGKTCTILNVGFSVASDWSMVTGSIQAGGVVLASCVAAQTEGNGNAYSMEMCKTIPAGNTINFIVANAASQARVAMAWSGVESNV